MSDEVSMEELKDTDLSVVEIDLAEEGDVIEIDVVESFIDDPLAEIEPEKPHDDYGETDPTLEAYMFGEEEVY